uniref:Transmembrane and immunoglobulin domain containing 3 n=1 Tax=Urocitellus parryii TaxID=9999 RepID=A0A8D2IN92_UROPR
PEPLCLLPHAASRNAMVMDRKVKESFVLGTASASCNYDAHYKHHTKYWCRGYFRDYCHIIALTPNSTDRVALKDTGSQFIITVSCLTKEDTGWYWCGIQRDFARDDMDFTELIVTDSRGGQANEFWSGKGRGCQGFYLVKLALIPSRMSILIICVLLTSLGIIFIISHLSKRRRSQRNRRGLGSGPQNSQASPVNPTSLVSSILDSSALGAVPHSDLVFRSPRFLNREETA